MEEDDRNGDWERVRGEKKKKLKKKNCTMQVGRYVRFNVSRYLAYSTSVVDVEMWRWAGTRLGISMEAGAHCSLGFALGSLANWVTRDDKEFYLLGST